MASLRALALALWWLPVAAAGEPAAEGAAGGQEVVSELRGGVLAHDVPGLWSGFRREHGVDLTGEIVFVRRGWPLPWGRLRPNLGFAVNTQGDTSQFYAGIVWELEYRGLFFDAALDAAIHDGRIDSDRTDRKKFGGRGLFRSGFDLGYTFLDRHRLMVSFSHVSNGSTGVPNEGLDTLGVRYGFLFH